MCVKGRNGPSRSPRCHRFEQSRNGSTKTPGNTRLGKGARDTAACQLTTPHKGKTFRVSHYGRKETIVGHERFSLLQDITQTPNAPSAIIYVLAVGYRQKKRTLPAILLLSLPFTKLTRALTTSNFRSRSKAAFRHTHR